MNLHHLILVFTIILLAGSAHAQSVYRYQDDNGQWHYTDLPPADGRAAQVDVIKQINLNPTIIVTRETSDSGSVVYAENEYHGAVEFQIRLLDARNVGGNLGDEPIHMVLPPAQKITVLQVPAANPAQSVSFRYEYKYMLGEPEAKHDGEYLYRVPFGVAQSFPVSQAYPLAITHGGTENRHAVDFAMPVGTPVHAARDGTVVAIAFRSFSGGTNASDAPKANIVRIVHDDGTIATYAHLRLDSVRVRPGDTVRRGQYIADSGNTGFSTGPHLHFAVGRNVGFRTESVAVLFFGAGNKPERAQTGQRLMAY